MALTCAHLARGACSSGGGARPPVGFARGVLARSPAGSPAGRAGSAGSLRRRARPAADRTAGCPAPVRMRKRTFVSMRLDSAHRATVHYHMSQNSEALACPISSSRRIQEAILKHVSGLAMHVPIGCLGMRMPACHI